MQNCISWITACLWFEIYTLKEASVFFNAFSAPHNENFPSVMEFPFKIKFTKLYLRKGLQNS